MVNYVWLCENVKVRDKNVDLGNVQSVLSESWCNKNLSKPDKTLSKPDKRLSKPDKKIEQT